MKPEINEKDLLARLADNDRKAIETVYREHFNMVQSLVINNNGSVDDAKDVFQDAILVLYEKVKSGGFELTSQLKTYLYSVSRRLWLKKLQKMSRFNIPVETLESLMPVEEDIEEHEKKSLEFEIMEKAIISLGEPCKSLLEAYYFYDMPMQDIAINFGYTNADNAKNQKYKCLMRLKKIFFTNYKNGKSDE